MQRAGKMIWLFVGVISLAVAVSWYLMSPVECRMEIAVSVGDGNAIEIKDLATIAVKVKSASECIRERNAVESLVRKYISMNPDCPENKVRKMLENVRVEQNDKRRMLWTVKAIAQTSKEAKNVAEFYVDSIIQYFAEDQKRFERKMSAWFDQQIYHKRNRNESVSDLERAKQDGLRKEQAKSIKIKKSSVSKIRRLYFSWWFNGTVEKE